MKAQPSKRRGFTLVELLVALGITAFLASLMVSVVAQAAELWARSAGRLSCEAKARLVFDETATDIAGVLFRDDGGRWLSAEIAPQVAGDIGAGGGKPLGIISHALGNNRWPEARFGTGGTWLRLLTTRRGRNANLETISAPVLVSYRIFRREGGSRFSTYLLSRAELPPEPAMNLDVEEPRSAGEFQTAIADGVIDFGIRCVFDDHEHGSPNFCYPPIPEAADEGTTRIPAAVDVLVRILTDEGAGLLARFEARGSEFTDTDTAGEAWWNLAQQHSHVFTRRVILNAGAR